MQIVCQFFRLVLLVLMKIRKTWCFFKWIFGGISSFLEWLEVDFLRMIYWCFKRPRWAWLASLIGLFGFRGFMGFCDLVLIMESFLIYWKNVPQFFKVSRKGQGQWNIQKGSGHHEPNKSFTKTCELNFPNKSKE